MSDRFPLVPRYRLEDEEAWLVGVDPHRRYWLLVNGDEAKPVILPGLCVGNLEGFSKAISAFKAMAAGDTLELPTGLEKPLVIQCASKNCFVIDTDVNGHPAAHLFDQESLESLLMTAHPDWRKNVGQADVEGQTRSQTWADSAAAQAA